MQKSDSPTGQKSIFETVKSYLTVKDYLETQGYDTSKHFHCINPEHADENPSMKIDPYTGKAHCFGECGKEYDILDCVGFIENIPDKKDQARRVCEITGHELPAGWGRRSAESDFSEELNAQKYNFDEQTTKAVLELNKSGKKVLDYLRRRGFDDKTINDNRVGYVKAGFDYFADPNKKPDGKPLIIGKKGPYYNIFFPYIDHTGHIPYFLAELGDRRNEGKKVGRGELSKYIKPPIKDAPLYNERYLMGYSAPKFCFICEGIYDAWSIEQAGRKVNAKAIALNGLGGTEHTKPILQKYRPKTVFLLGFDNDAAGIKATEKWRALFDELKIPYRVTCPPDLGNKSDWNDALIADPKGLEQYITDLIEFADAPPLKVGRSIQYGDCARYANKKTHAIVVNGGLHIYTGQQYTRDKLTIARKMGFIWDDLTINSRRELLDKMEISAPPRTEAPAHLTQFSNGVYDFRTKQLEPLSADRIILNTIPHAYDPTAPACPVVDQAFSNWTLGNKELETLLFEWIGYNFYRGVPFHKFVILDGGGRNGKSTYANVLKHVLGAENCSAVPLEDIGERFKKSAHYGKLANIQTENEGRYLGESSILKVLSAGDPIQAEYKGKDSFEYTPYTKLTFGLNNTAQFRDRTQALLKRMIIIPFDANFTEHPDVLLTAKLTTPEATAYIIRKSVDAFNKVLERGGFTIPDAVKQKINEQNYINNPHELFFEEKGRDWFIGRATMDAYDDYKYWCSRNSHKPISNVGLGKAIAQSLDLVTKLKKVSGNAVRIYAERE